jgi:hypothetical protein
VSSKERTNFIINFNPNMPRDIRFNLRSHQIGEKPSIHMACWRKGHFTLSYAFFQNPTLVSGRSFFPMQLMYSLMKHDYTFENVASRHKICL